MEEPAVLGIVDCLLNSLSPLLTKFALETESARPPTSLALEYGQVIKSCPVLSKWKSVGTEALLGKISSLIKKGTHEEKTVYFFRYCVRT